MTVLARTRIVAKILRFVCAMLFGMQLALFFAELAHGNWFYAAWSALNGVCFVWMWIAAKNLQKICDLAEKM